MNLENIMLDERSQTHKKNLSNAFTFMKYPEQSNPWRKISGYQGLGGGH